MFEIVSIVFFVFVSKTYDLRKKKMWCTRNMCLNFLYKLRSKYFFRAHNYLTSNDHDACRKESRCWWKAAVKTVQFTWKLEVLYTIFFRKNPQQKIEENLLNCFSVVTHAQESWWVGKRSCDALPTNKNERKMSLGFLTSDSSRSGFRISSYLTLCVF